MCSSLLSTTTSIPFGPVLVKPHGVLLTKQSSIHRFCLSHGRRRIECSGIFVNLAETLDTLVGRRIMVGEIGS